MIAFEDDIANPTKANLSHAILSSSYITGANLSDADLTDTDLRFSIMIGVKFDDKKRSYPLCKNAKFNKATIIDDESLREHFCKNSNNPESIPPAVKNRNDLKERLREIGHNRSISEEDIKRLLSISSLTR